MVSVTNEPRSAPTIPYWPWGYVATGIIAVAAILIAPLAAYVFLIAMFGLPHVLCELRYCDERFCARAPRAALILIGVLLAALVILRLALPAGLISSSIATTAELGVGIALVLSATWFMRSNRLVGLLAGAAIGTGIVVAPIMTFLIFAWLHNLTPLGFIAEIVPRRDRARVVAMLLFPFLLLPALVASGVLQEAIAKWFGYSLAQAPSLFGAGRYPLSAFLTGGVPFPNALPLFSAAVTAQAMHYLSVIIVMPALLARYGQASPRPIVPWPSWRGFAIAVAIIALLFFSFNALDYKTARIFYGVVAAIHSWVELPIFLLALGAALIAAQTRSSPQATK